MAGPGVQPPPAVKPSNGVTPSSPEAFEAVVADYVSRAYRRLYEQYQAAEQRLHSAHSSLRAPLGKSQEARQLPKTLADDIIPMLPLEGSTPNTPRTYPPLVGEAKQVTLNDDVSCNYGDYGEALYQSSAFRSFKPAGHLSARRLDAAPDWDDSEPLASWSAPAISGLEAHRSPRRKKTRQKSNLDSRETSFSRALTGFLVGKERHDPVLRQVRSRLVQASVDHVDTYMRTLLNHFSAEPRQQNEFLARIVCSKPFESLCSLVIIINTAFIAYSSNYAMANLHEPETVGMQVIELSFCAFYAVELVLRLLVFRGSYICSTEWAWNTLDVFLVAVSVQEIIMAGLSSNSESSLNMSFLRILRIMKMMKLFRVVRLLRMFRELRLIWSSIVGCAKPVFWATVLIAATSFMVGVCFLQAATGYIREKELEISREELEELANLWGTVQHSMLSLYMCVTNGADWADIADSLVNVGMPYYMLFLLYILFYTCVVANTLTSLFVESTMVNADKDQQHVIQNALEQADKIIDKLRGWFMDVDSDGNGFITYEEFCEALNDPRSVAFASTLDLGMTDLKQFFAALSLNGKQPVDLETFVVGCIKLRGWARSMDLMELMYFHRQNVQQTRLQQLRFHEFCLAKFESIKSLQLETAGVIRNLAKTSEQGSMAPAATAAVPAAAVSPGAPETPAVVETKIASSIEKEAPAGGELRSLAATLDKEVHLAASPGELAAPLLERLTQGGSLQEQQEAASALRELALSAEGQEVAQLAVSTPGVLEALVKMTKTGSSFAKTIAAGALRNLATLADSTGALASVPGVLQALVAMTKDGSHAERESAAGALRNLAANFENSIRIAAIPGALKALLAMMQSGCGGEKVAATGALRNLAANNDNKVRIAFMPGALEALVAMLRSNSRGVKEPAAGALRNLATNDDNSVRIAAIPGALEALVALTKHGSSAEKAAAAGALRSLAFHVESTDRSQVLPGALEVLMAMSEDGGNSSSGWGNGAKDYAPGSMRSLGFHAESTGRIAGIPGALEALVAMTRDGSSDEKEQAAGALGNLADWSDDDSVRIASVAGALEALVAMITDGSSSSSEKVAAAGSLWNLAVNAENKSRIAAVSGALEALVRMTQNGSLSEKMAAAGALSELVKDGQVRRAIDGVPGSRRALLAMKENGSYYAASALAALERHDSFAEDWELDYEVLGST
eukprot:TRINITY_DN20259_c0_g1_i1.p1 TRINITY_DN20259_c0_g1~~TRINITY_DN20259_c0_g1_i1.p1  ORF type:complete len:1209 (-),score=344.57 TRINITY_DN20259_c0_g1_i1:176-3772(-)